MSPTPSGEPGTGMEPEQVAASKEGEPVTQKKPPAPSLTRSGEGVVTPCP